MNTIIFTNQKGGVGKTTLTRELALAIASNQKKVLIIDSDPQGNLTKSLLDDSDRLLVDHSLYSALEGEAFTPVAIRPSLDLLSGDKRLSALEKRYLGDVDAYSKLSNIFESGAFESYDLVLIDSPPSLGVMTLNGLAAANHFVIPLRPALYSLQGTNDLLASVAKVRKSLNPGLELLGVVINDYLSGPIISRQIKQEVQESFGDKLFSTVISRTVKVEEAIADRKGIVERGESKMMTEVVALASELFSRLGL